eukprot:CAMPEP_0185592412 /NCGR_PEP_ID=MMETSP0434-20130131/67885_1 /TAXON_ID=626734 ORGANISM="Favella taraikaensis, Strain Fe Narragansett Bay" /NCGR_SAMPLE_ID=MMETSP0434 /ASSEMBLY_ACC=CAM_ASM_000379 /LENGTH=47 /DNA_ID= /DNA_START= /DNA_END= /DNA_ORIENTATION=
MQHSGINQMKRRLENSAFDPRPEQALHEEEVKADEKPLTEEELARKE